MNWISSNIWLILFIIWGIPLGIYRSKFRKISYQTDDWKINIKPLFTRELKALFGNLYPENEEYLKIRNFYRFYLSIYCLLFILYKILDLSVKKQHQIKKSAISILKRQINRAIRIIYFFKNARVFILHACAIPLFLYQGIIKTID
jgi:hypothetical protein